MMESFSRRVCSIVLTHLFVFGLMISSAWAEVVTLVNGDHISGVVLKQTESTLTLKTSYAGAIHIERSQIQHVGKRIEKRTVTSNSENKEQSPPPKAASGVSALDPTLLAGTASALRKKSEKGTFTGNTNFSMKLEDGNNNKNEIDIDFAATYRRGIHRGRTLGTLEYDTREGDNIKRDWQVIASYDRFLSDKLFASLMYSAKQEKFAGLDLRQSLGPSVGYQFYDGKPVELMSSLGIYYVLEDFVAQPDNRYLGPGWQLQYKHDIYKEKLQFYHRHYSILSAEESDKWLWHSWTGLSMPLIGGIVGSAEFEIDYDSQPALRAETMDTTLRLKLGYQW
jgi:putative salt-induced outer membrane protein YdiY